jgi:hypothetical protein
VVFGALDLTGAWRLASCVAAKLLLYRNHNHNHNHNRAVPIHTYTDPADAHKHLMWHETAARNPPPALDYHLPRTQTAGGSFQPCRPSYRLVRHSRLALASPLPHLGSDSFEACRFLDALRFRNIACLSPASQLATRSILNSALAKAHRRASNS